MMLQGKYYKSKDKYEVKRNLTITMSLKYIIIISNKIIRKQTNILISGFK